MQKIPALFAFCMMLAIQVQGQTDTLRNPGWLQRSDFGIYGVINYYNYDWQTDSVLRNAIDNERMVIEFNYQRSERLAFSTEIEFEHGGTGASVEFDRFEEFGEFEFDISKGGEVWIEQMYLDVLLGRQSHLTIGRFQIPFGMMHARSEPVDYPTASPSEAEITILPNNWSETGIGFNGQTGLGASSHRIKYFLAAVNGLDNSGFNSANWIKRGHQRRFELINAENFALCGRLDVETAGGTVFGVSAYYGNTTGNRPKPDLKVRAPLFLTDVHLLWKYRNAFVNSLLMYGRLGNSEAVTNTNRNLSNNLNVKRTPVGAAALAGFIEIGYTFLRHPSFLSAKESAALTGYVRGDYYDTMQDTEGLVFNNPRWERTALTFGCVYEVLNDVQLKLQYTHREVGAPAPTSINGGTSENTLVAGIAFEF